MRKTAQICTFSLQLSSTSVLIRASHPSVNQAGSLQQVHINRHTVHLLTTACKIHASCRKTIKINARSQQPIYYIPVCMCVCVCVHMVSHIWCSACDIAAPVVSSATVLQGAGVLKVCSWEAENTTLPWWGWPTEAHCIYRAFQVWLDVVPASWLE